MKPEANALLSRFYVYQKERFPFLTHGILIAAFSFSAVSYSRLAGGKSGFIDWRNFLVCAMSTLSIFFLLRIFDEFKDREDDAKYRSYLPVPRGLISLAELKNIGIFAFAFLLLLNLSFSLKISGILCIVLGYLMLMGKEFFMAEWLRRHQFWYVVSHMMIIPLVDVYASSYDWLLEGTPAPKALLFFFLVSFLNGVVLEIGRKIKSPGDEEEGVLSYTFQMGTRKAVIFWIFILSLTLAAALIACRYASHPSLFYYLLAIVFIICSIPAIVFLRKPERKAAKFIEYSSAFWTLCMYLILGGIPMLLYLV